MENTVSKFSKHDTVFIPDLDQYATVLTEYSESQRKSTQHDYLIILKDGTEVEALESHLIAA